MKKISVILLCVLIISTLISGCGKSKSQDTNDDNSQDIEFEILDKDAIPQKVLEKIFEKKEQEFQFCYKDGKELYIVLGYGAKPTGGYSIKVIGLQKGEDKIVVKAELIEPSKEEVVVKDVSYPYIVLKIKDLGLDVEYQVK